MTPQQIFERLHGEFPDHHVSFDLEVASYRYSNGDAAFPNITMKIWCGGEGQVSIPCASLEEGIAALKSRLGMGVSEMELTV